MIVFFTFISKVTADDLAGQQCQQHRCIAVVDAGSTGTRLHIYAFDVNEKNDPVNIKDIWSNKIKPGFATLNPDPETINTYLSSLFAPAPEQNLPVYFYATAGMRLLPQPKQQQYYQTLQQWFAAQPQWQLVESKTITGKAEGLYGWLAVNYQLGALSNPSQEAASVMDMGGASVQVVFPVQNDSVIDPSDIIEIDVYGRHMKLFVHSFLGLGQTVLSHQFLDASNCFANDYLLPNGTPAQGDAPTCKRDVSRLINTVHSVSRIVKPAVAANPGNTWYVIGGLAALAQDKPFQFQGNQLTNQSLLQQADNIICHQQWDALQTQYPNNEYIYGYCLFPSYYYALMVHGYGLSPSEPVRYLANSQNVDWTLGVVLHHQQTQV
ncbi:multidrug DMT transporter permease [Legionella septentrionalis]|uniref:Multidrug DMT transporter permease n=2 Tax=Legionellaceae TaxID=444 RepID=A0A3S0VA74_9GAMM|nr:multidrug DMT transporter permease [Legionella septentrionalis]RUQ95764.1 multidrug DMT transporter permease [Legionella septentrionalis]RUR09155.1 multidrug DMT transporter permease [Legionella septentrionalis]RUR15664.1 multidrug DMT transporter permease [Legionella septentrionalis]